MAREAADVKRRKTKRKNTKPSPDMG